MANPMYSPWLQYAPTFRWGGREWGEGDLAAFIKKIGGAKKYDKWARQHRVAAKSFDPTEGEIYSQVQPVITGIDAERKKRAEYYTRLIGNQAGFTTALMSQLGQISPAIGNAYSEAASTIGATGTGYGRTLNADTARAAAVDNATLAAAGAPEGQQIKGGDAGGVLAGLAGWLPQEMLNTQGGAFASAAAELPETASIEAQINMKSILQKAMEEDEDFSTQITSLLQKIPGFKSESKQNQLAINMKKKEFALKALESKRDWYIDQQKLAMLAGDKVRANEYLKLAQQQEARMAAASAGYDAFGEVKPDYHIDPTTGAPIKNGWRVNPKTGMTEKTGGGKGGSTSSTVPGTPAYKAKTLKEVGAARAKINKDITTMIRKPTIDEIRSGKYKPTDKVIPKWEDAYKQLYAAYKYLVPSNMPAAKKRLDEVIRAALAAAGIKPSGSGAKAPGKG